MLAEKFGKYSDYASVVLRVALGAVLFWHGQAKLLNLEATAGFLAQSFPAPMLLAVIVAVIETVGGAFLVLGLLTRFSALLVALEFVVILRYKVFVWGIPFVDFQTGVGGYQLDMIILAAAVALLLRGSKKLSLEQMLFKKELI